MTTVEPRIPGSSLEIPAMLGIGDSNRRTLDATGPAVPSGTLVVSADSHWLEPPDLWAGRFPDHLKERAPRMFWDEGGWQMEVNGKVAIGPLQAKGFATFETIEGMNQVGPRLADLDVEGVDVEVLFPQRTLGLIRASDLEYRAWCLRAWNEYLAEQCAQAPERLHGVGIVRWWDPEGAADSVAELVELGYRSVMAPIEPGKGPDGEPIEYNHPRFDAFWAAVEASGLPLCFHIGENTKVTGYGATGSFVLEQTGGFRNLWGHLVFGGVFDRFPGLKVVFVEGGLSWVPHALQDADMIFESFHSQLHPKIEHTPSHYWHQNCWATFMTDAAGLELLHRIGPTKALWSSDYPHNESTLGYTRSAVQAVFDRCSPEDARRVVGQNAVDLFGLPVPSRLLADAGGAVGAGGSAELLRNAGLAGGPRPNQSGS